MSRFRNIKDIFHSLLKDGKFFLLILASILVTIYFIAPYFISYDSIARIFALYIPFSFAVTIIAWIITDKCLLRTPYPYISVFFLLFFVNVYWSLFYWIFPPTYDKISETSHALSLGCDSYINFNSEWLNLKTNATYLYIVIEFFVIVFLFLIFWYLSNPSDFSKYFYKRLDFFKNRRFKFFVLGLFFISLNFWLFYLLYYLFGYNIFDFFMNFDMISWLNTIFTGLPISLGLVFFSMIITKIKDQIKYILYLFVFIFSFIPFLPIYLLFDTNINDYLFVIFQIFIYFICSFLLFLTFVLLSKTRYIEQ